MEKGKNIHVVPHNGDWATRAEGNERVTRTYPTKQEAIDAGRQTARNNQSELVIHNQNGQIGQKDSHGHDPFPPRG